MNILEFFRKKPVNSDAVGEVSENFSENIGKAIRLLGSAEGPLEDSDVVQLLRDNAIDSADVGIITAFLPMAFCRRMLPEGKFEDKYYLLQKGEKKMKYGELSKTKAYLMIWQEVDNYYSNKPQKEVILKIAGRSAEFRAANDLLNSNPAYGIGDIQFTPVYVTLL